MTVTIGIDPGISGAVAVVNQAGEVLVWDMPTIEVRGKRRISAVGLRDLLVDIGPAVMTVVEDVQGVQGSGATSAFAFGRGCGVIEGTLVALQRPTTYVRPQESGYKTDVRWVALTRQDGLGLLAVGLPLVSAGASPFLYEDYDAARGPGQRRTVDMAPRDVVSLNVDLAQMGVGAPYVVARVLGYEAGLVTSPSYEYGNTFTAVAGLLNILVILDALDTARGVRGK